MYGVIDKSTLQPRVLNNTEQQDARTGLGLGNVDNTRDADKPVSGLQQQAIADSVTAARVAAVATSMTYAQRCALLGISLSTTAPDPALYRWYADAAGSIHYSNGTAWSTI